LIKPPICTKIEYINLWIKPAQLASGRSA